MTEEVRVKLVELGEHPVFFFFDLQILVILERTDLM